MTSFSDIIQEVQDNLNEPIISGFEVVRLVGCGIAEDGSDYYYIVNSTDSKYENNRYRISCVGGLMPLKLLDTQGCVISSEGVLWTDYTRLDSWLSLNGAPKVDNIIIENLAVEEFLNDIEHICNSKEIRNISEIYTKKLKIMIGKKVFFDGEDCDFFNSEEEYGISYTDMYEIEDIHIGFYYESFDIKIKLKGVDELVMLHHLKFVEDKPNK